MPRLQVAHTRKEKTRSMTAEETMTTRRPLPRRRRVTFRIEAGPESDVRLAGTFNQWDPSAQRLGREKGNGTHAATLLLPVGRYEYKFIVDGQWQCNPACTDRVANEYGSLNSVIEVR